MTRSYVVNVTAAEGIPLKYAMGKDFKERVKMDLTDVACCEDAFPWNRASIIALMVSIGIAHVQKTIPAKAPAVMLVATRLFSNKENLDRNGFACSNANM